MPGPAGVRLDGAWCLRRQGLKEGTVLELATPLTHLQLDSPRQEVRTVPEWQQMLWLQFTVSHSPLAESKRILIRHQLTNSMTWEKTYSLCSSVILEAADNWRCTLRNIEVMYECASAGTWHPIHLTSVKMLQDCQGQPATTSVLIRSLIQHLLLHWNHPFTTALYLPLHSWKTATRGRCRGKIVLVCAHYTHTLPGIGTTPETVTFPRICKVVTVIAYFTEYQ